MEMQTQVQPQARQVVKSVRQQVQDAFGSVEMQAALSVVPPWIDRQEFAAQAAADAADPALASVPLPELVRGYLTIARMGMMPGPCKHVARVPRGQTLDVQAQWQGVQYVLRQGGWAVSAHIVLHDDRLELATVGPDEFDVLRHDYADPFARVVTKANLRGAYAKGVNLRTGETIYRMVPLERIERANKAAKTQAIWNSDFAAMVSKTVFHQAASRRWFPLAADVQAALAMAEELDFDPTPKERKPLSIGVAAAPLRLVQEVQQEPEQLVLTADQDNHGDEVQS